MPYFTSSNAIKGFLQVYESYVNGILLMLFSIGCRSWSLFLSEIIIYNRFSSIRSYSFSMVLSQAYSPIIPAFSVFTFFV